MKKLVIVLFIILVSLVKTNYVQAQTTYPSAQLNGSLGGEAQILYFDWGRSAWCIHPENGNIRIKTGTVGTSPTPGNPPSPLPSSTVGFEIVSGSTWCSTMKNSTTDPRPEVDGAPESGTVAYSAWVDYSQSP